MPNKLVKDLQQIVLELQKQLHNHLIESGGIKTQLSVNTWLTGIILAALLTRFIADFFKR